jgi:hypothetical protein
MTAKVISLSDFQKSKEGEKKLRRGRELGLPDFEMEEESAKLVIEFEPDFEIDDDVVLDDDEEEE